MSEKLAWYSMGTDLQTVDHEPVALAEAVGIAKKYYANAGAKYADGEQALAETMFGFMRDKKTFIEFCVNGAADISLRFETPKNPDARFLKGTFQYESTLKSWAEIEQAITGFFTHGPAQFRARLEQR